MDLLILSTALIFGLIAQKTGLPPLVGFLLAGFGLHAANVEPVPLLDSLTNIGVQLLLFSIGLKIDIKGLLSKAIWLGSSLHTILFCISSLVVFITIAALGYVIDTDINKLALIGFILSFSSTICVVTLLELKAELKTPHGQICLGILIMQDIFAVAFLTASSGKVPSIYALGLIALPLIIPLLNRIIELAGHTELLPLSGFAIALAGGTLFEIVGLKADLGALVFGALLSTQVKASELAKAMAQFKDLFLVGFFLSIGFVALPTFDILITAISLTLLLPIKGFLFFVILSAFKVRKRSAFLSSLALTNFSEFGLIVAALASKNQWLTGDWLVIVAIAMSISFVGTSVLNTHSHQLYEWLKPMLTKVPTRAVEQNEAKNIQESADVLIVGMGRVGLGAYEFLNNRGSNKIACVDADSTKVTALSQQGYNIYHADAENLEFWQSVDINQFKIILLALPTVNDLLETYRLLQSNHFTGEVCGLAKYNDDIEILEEAGINAVYNLYQEAGFGLASHAVKTLSHFQKSPEAEA